jgi:hypothetical protein
VLLQGRLLLVLPVPVRLLRVLLRGERLLFLPLRLFLFLTSGNRKARSPRKTAPVVVRFVWVYLAKTFRRMSSNPRGYLPLVGRLIPVIAASSYGIDVCVCWLSQPMPATVLAFRLFGASQQPSRDYSAIPLRISRSTFSGPDQITRCVPPASRPTGTSAFCGNLG